MPTPDHEGSGGENPSGVVPAEYLVDHYTNANPRGLRNALERFRNSQHVLTDAIKGNKHIVAKVGPLGRVVIIGGGVAGGIFLCKRLLKHRHNPRTDKLNL